MWRDLLQKDEVIVSPWLEGRSLRTFARSFRIEGPLPPEPGWHRFEVAGRKARYCAGAELDESALGPRVRGYLIGDRLVPDAQYWLGESMFQRQRYRDAAEQFLGVSTKFENNARAPDALLRLGQSLAAMGEREAACASLAEVARKYPRASVAVRQGVEREQKRVRC